MQTEAISIKVAAEQWVPWTRVTSRPDGGINLSGPTGKLMEILSQIMKFEYELVRPPDGLWGAEQPDRSWSGMIGMVHREEVEFALGPFTMTPQRESVTDFAIPLASENQAIIMERPTQEMDMGGFLKAFTAEVWILIMLSMVAISCTTILLVRAESRVFGRVIKNINSHIMLWVLKALTQEGSEWLPKDDAGRLLVTTWLVASLVFMSSYSGILTAMLTVPRVTIPIDSLADLVAQNDVPWRLEAGSMTPRFLMDSGDPVRQKVVTASSGTFPDCWSSRQSIVDGEFVAICDETTMKKTMAWDFSTTGECHLYIAREKVFSSAWMGVAFKSNSSYLARANTIILTVKEAGLVEHWLGQEIVSTPQCLRSPTLDRQDGVAPFDLETLLGPILVLAAGWCLALLTFVGENIVVALMSPSRPPPPSVPR